MDFEELAAWLGIHNSRANHPCPQCLVHHDELHQLTNTFPLRTTESMSWALSCAPDAPKTACNDYLKSYGLHNFKVCHNSFEGNNGTLNLVQHFLWSFNNSDPYRMSGYDCLHYFDGGIWGHHTFWTILKVIRHKLGKDFNFLKQHSLSHALNDIRTKGTSRNMNIRVGEGFQQEMSAMYQKTNGKRAEHQISVLDENEETMAHLDMESAMWLHSQNAVDPEENLLPPPSVASGHWTLGSPELVSLADRISYHLILLIIEPCKTLYLNFQSTMDWKEGQDVLRCNAKFHGRKRYNSVMYAANDDPMAMGHLEFLFRCHPPYRRTIDLALVRPYRASNWSPRTRTDCPIREWQPAHAEHCKATFVALEHTVRGALVCPIFGAPREVFYVVDCIVADMFLRIHEIK
ncbi:hypothetical protein DFH08DRAFT_926312 [Mycena albidolilacea]|uniref:Uncharacterized protein n=1 Tax=Mycena albidolilacea TaxID=1033008 RepID=A0AAD7EH47_9AGAR|nr:hypothetical protein DFH08DRAFT_926312 [Mycena albidolilacea]